MRLSFRLSVMVLVVALAGASSCTSILQALKITDDTPVESRAPEPVPAPDEKDKRAKEVPPPPYAPPVPPDQEKAGKEWADLRNKDEINDSALQFAKNSVPGFLHAKTCYSKLYGGWYLLLYVKKGQNISLQQYSWHEKSREWEPMYQQKLPKEDMERHLKIDVAGERCFRLK